VLEHTIVEMGMRWELLDAVFNDDVPDRFEFGFVLRRSTVPANPRVMADRLRLSWQVLASKSREDAEACAPNCPNPGAARLSGDGARLAGATPAATPGHWVPGGR